MTYACAISGLRTAAECAGSIFTTTRENFFCTSALRAGIPEWLPTVKGPYAVSGMSPPYYENTTHPPVSMSAAGGNPDEERANEKHEALLKK